MGACNCNTVCIRKQPELDLMKPENLTIHVSAGQIREHYATHPDLNTVSSKVLFSEGF
jgi:hypothetical protein